ncbi:NrfD/PsrC family molybdoenzyme membrane anchor subunit [Calderihabitans maritimus]|uniref:Polysulfide reductase NrfD n=1 Tax=Calderihabitans maritimus TaxID=1246530 RepID=A0A1Z5HNI3_9FIRM|nr:Ni/Fe-hydrogenase cytochrome b subunit [Calderihabitans maritimus]GAW91089.1 polysulfide reductase NrfD [Calderihabitans maritimus]
MKRRKFSFKITPFRVVLMFLSALFIGVSIYRLINGLGVATNLSDEWPWGLWILVDVKLGVALAAGGFTTVGLYHIFGVKKLKPIVKPAVLTAWLGYLMVGVGLLLDLGRWYNFWHPIVYWGHHSVMFELFWCVLLYTLVLTGEFGPTIFKRLGWKGIAKGLTGVTIPLVILGIVLSTLHQSSLGSLYILMAGKLHPLWWSMLLPVFYFLTAVAVGPAMVTVESYLSARAYKREFELDIMQTLGKFSAWVLGIYFVLRLIDLAYRGYLGAVFSGTLEGNMFLLEIMLGVILPLLIYLVPNFRKTVGGVVTAATLTIVGVILNRTNVVFTGMWASAGTSYVPSWMEVAITLGLISTGVLAYQFFVENFEVFAEESHESEGALKMGRPQKFGTRVAS